MDFSRLENNLIDIIQEEQVKLGYQSETIRLYYPIASLNRFLSQSLSIEQMHQALKEFCDFAEERLGRVEISSKGERFCFAIPPQGVDYVHEHRKGTEFICDLIHTIERHDCTWEDILAQFYKHSDQVHVEKTDHGEFDYLVYFENGEPDAYRYCITDEGCHFIYHRFTEEDYRDFQFEE